MATGYYMDMAQRLLKKVRKDLGGGWEFMTPEVQKALVLSEASSVILGWTAVGEGGTAKLENAQELIRCVHGAMDPKEEQ